MKGAILRPDGAVRGQARSFDEFARPPHQGADLVDHAKQEAGMVAHADFAFPERAGLAVGGPAGYRPVFSSLAMRSATSCLKRSIAERA
jgi:hypothetical protein